MYSLCCTQKLLTRLKGEVQPVPQASSTVLGNWYATVLPWRPQFALLVSEPTLLPVVMPLAPAATLATRFPSELRRMLAALGMDDRFIDHELSAMSRYIVTKTANRSAVGMLNEFSFLADAFRTRLGLQDALSLSIKLAGTPCGPLKGNRPIDLIAELQKTPLG